MTSVAVAAKVAAETALSLYPSFVKHLRVALPVQIWTRCLAYVAIAALFVDWDFVAKQLHSKWGLALATVTVVHIYTSYKGFQLMGSGNAYTLFYTYPLFILLFAGKLPLYLGAVVATGSAFLARNENPLGVAMIFLAAITEALIYYVAVRIPTKNSWNHIFLSYFAGAVALTALVAYKFNESFSFDVSTLQGLGGNALLGLFGYYLRFYAIARLPTFEYAALSIVGIVTSYGFGYYLDGEVPALTQIVGAAFMALSVLMAKQA
jgi:hypothetical protein